MLPIYGRRSFFILLALLGGGLIWHLCYRYVESNALALMEQVLEGQQVELDRQLDQLSFIAKILADDTEIREALVAQRKDAVMAANLRLHKTQIASGLDFAFLLDKTGLTVAASNYRDALSFVGISYSFRPYFINAIRGMGATYFAVGATTGVPGYFIAEPVVLDNVVLGVVVTKMDLQVLVNAWSDKGFLTTLNDEFGVVILSTDENLLYTPTRPMSEAQKQRVADERRYPLRDGILLPVSNQPEQRLRVDSAKSGNYLVVEKSLAKEPWSLSTLMTLQRIKQDVAFLVAAIVAVLLILYLLVRVYSQQQRLMISQQRNAHELEELVQQRTVELASAQQRLISESNFSMLGRMSAAINHEINQPLASLRFNLASLRKLIAQDAPDDTEIEQIVIDSDRTTKRIGRVINSLRSVTSRGDTRFVDLRLDSVVLDVLQTVRRERPTLSAIVKVSEPLPEIVVVGEEVLIQQAMLNLLYNAFDAVASVDQPVINVSLELCTGDVIDSHKLKDDVRYASVSVIDNGAGVSDDIADSLFEPFASGRGLVDGLGLGLTISLQIAHDHGGELLYARSGHQTGSCFMLILPYG
ncbi:MAG: ATP-binding protein [Granulosicoccus sp.]